MDPSKYGTSWQYGYTLGPPSAANNGDYQIYQNAANYQQQQQQHYYGTAASGVRQTQPSLAPQQSSNNIVIATTNAKPPKSWADIKPKVPPSYFKTKVFVTSSKPLPGTISSTTTSPVAGTSAVTVSSSTSAPSMIGPSKPGASDDTEDAFGSSCMQLHDLALQNKLAEKYESAAEPGAGFMVTLTLGGEKYQGRGSTIKAGEQNAAMQALANTSYKTKQTMKARPSGITPTSELHELATKKGLNVDFQFIEPYNFNYSKGMKMWKKEEMRGHYKVKLKVGALEFLGEGDLPQVAKHNAAIQGIPTIRGLPNAKSLGTSVAVAASKASSSGVVSSTSFETFRNPVMQINELAITRGIHPEWTMLSEEGPPHMKSFKWQLKMGTMVTVGAGASKKIARSQAASNMLVQLPDDLKATVAKLAKNVPGNKGKKGKKRKMPAALPQTTMAAPDVMPPPLVPGLADAGPVIDPATAAKKPKVEAVAQPYTEIVAAGIPITISNLPKKKQTGVPEKGTPVHKVIVNSSPISALHEYCRKARISEPEFDCVAENVLETWQKDNHTFKKTEYTMRLIVADKQYFATGNTKKVAKTRAATEAWNIIRTGTF